MTMKNILLIITLLFGFSVFSNDLNSDQKNQKKERPSLEKPEGKRDHKKNPSKKRKHHRPPNPPKKQKPQN